MDQWVHEPVLLAEVLGFLEPRPGKRLVDCTIGTGGHSEAILEGLGGQGFLLGIDCDESALRVAGDRLARFQGSFGLVHGNFAELRRLVAEAGLLPINGVLFDLGVSTMQLASAERGFSFSRTGPLDMRMDLSSGLTAGQLIRNSSQAELERIFRSFGEERFAGRIARAVVRERTRRPIETTTHLASLIARTMGRRGQRIHPATRCFQALRIAVNGELDNLSAALDALPEVLAPGARVVVIGFHSLEDRIVKTNFRAQADLGRYRLLTRKVVKPSREEVARNPRARSAKLRAAERVAP